MDLPNSRIEEFSKCAKLFVWMTFYTQMLMLALLPLSNQIILQVLFVIPESLVDGIVSLLLCAILTSVNRNYLLLTFV